jgi:hypothetical protein
MGSTAWIEMHGRPLRETAFDCSIVHHLIDNLDILAGKLGVQKLSGFYDWSDFEVAIPARAAAASERAV